MNFRFLTGDVNYLEYGGSWVSKRLNNGDWDYWLVIELINMHNATGDEEQDKYDVSLYAVSPEAAGEENLNRALDSGGLDDDKLRDNALVQVEALASYGIKALLWRDSGGNARKSLREARRESALVESFFGFCMDRRQNAIGNTGWDFIAGDIGFK
jgi:hypothetical protein